MYKSQTPKPVLGQTLKFDPPFFFKTGSAQRSLGGPSGTESLPMASLLTPWPPAGGSLPVAPARGSLSGAQAGSNLPVAPAGGLCF